MMNYRLNSSIVVGVFSKWSSHCKRTVLKEKDFVHLIHHKQRFVTVTSQVNKNNVSDLFHHLKLPIYHPKVCLNIKTMELVPGNESGFEKLMPESNFTSVLNVGESDGWLNIGAYSVFAWSVSGVESCIIVKSEDVQVVFDMGIALKESVRVPNVFITHGHIDHVAGVASHVAKRSLFSMKPARYFVPPHLLDPLKTIIETHHLMAEQGPSSKDINILPISEGETVRLNSRFFVKTFPTVHRIPSQGYILYKEVKTLKQEFKGMEGFEVAALHRDGTEIHDVVITPEIAYTGDTVMDLFLNPPIEDLLKVKLLITETTFLEENDKRGNNMVKKAQARGHIHLAEIAQNAHLFDNVDHILLVHFSSKYSPKYICDSIRDKLPSQLRSKVTPATVGAATRPSTYL